MLHMALAMNSGFTSWTDLEAQLLLKRHSVLYSIDLATCFRDERGTAAFLFLSRDPDPKAKLR